MAAAAIRVQAAEPSMVTELGVSGMSVATATFFTNPIDVVKTRLQLASSSGSSQASQGMVRLGVHMVRQEGASALMSGIGPAVARGVAYGGLRLGLYGPLKEAITTSTSSSTGAAQSAGAAFGIKLGAGTMAGALAALVSSPTELVKTRLQAANRPPGAATSSWGVVQEVVREDGVAGLWRGASPGMARAALLTATQCATYDEFKQMIMNLTGLGSDNVLTHFMSASAAGLITTTVTNPVDVIKTRMFVSTAYGGPLAAAADLMRTDGMRGFMKGWLANYSRLGPQTVIIFVVNEKLRELLGMQQL